MKIYVYLCCKCCPCEPMKLETINFPKPHLIRVCLGLEAESFSRLNCENGSKGFVCKKCDTLRNDRAQKPTKFQIFQNLVNTVSM